MYIEEAEKERFVSFTGENSKSSQGERLDTTVELHNCA